MIAHKRFGALLLMLALLVPILAACGGGGISLTLCAAAEAKQQKRDSTASSNAVPIVFLRSRFMKPFLMPPAVAGLVCYLNNFSDGMIHGLSCNRSQKRLHIPANAQIRATHHSSWRWSFSEPPASGPC